jgi:tRNA/rRNA methyltransferase
MTKQTNVAEPPAAETAVALTAPAVILVAPQLGENIGAAARAMANFGHSDLRLVNPRDGWPSETAVAAAAGADAVLDAAKVVASASEAVGDLHFVCGTTARVRDMIKPVLTPEAAVEEMVARAGTGQSCGIMFGQEKSGLGNDVLALCDCVVTAPVNPQFASLNLAQAVLLISYEWMRQVSKGSLGRKTAYDGPAREGLQMPHTRPATRSELIAFFEHLESELDASGFLWPPEKRPVMVRNLRNLFTRMAASEQEVRTLRGLVASLVRRGKGGNHVP